MLRQLCDRSMFRDVQKQHLGAAGPEAKTIVNPGDLLKGLVGVLHVGMLVDYFCQEFSNGWTREFLSWLYPTSGVTCPVVVNEM